MVDQIISASDKQPNPIDIHVGSRLRLRRMMLGLSQEKLGKSLGLTFQQIQKYEKGTNRIGASRLYEMSNILNVNIQFFFDDFLREKSSEAVVNHGDGEENIFDFFNSREGLELNRAFSQIKSPKVRRKIIELIKSICD